MVSTLTEGRKKLVPLKHCDVERFYDKNTSYPFVVSAKEEMPMRMVPSTWWRALPSIRSSASVGKPAWTHGIANRHLMKLHSPVPWSTTIQSIADIPFLSY